MKDKRIKAVTKLFQELYKLRPHAMNDALMARAILGERSFTYAQVARDALTVLYEAIEEDLGETASNGFYMGNCEKMCDNLVKARHLLNHVTARLYAESDRYDAGLFNEVMAIRETTEFTFANSFIACDYLKFWKIVLGRLCIFSQLGLSVPSREKLQATTFRPDLIEALLALNTYAIGLDPEEQPG